MNVLQIFPILSILNIRSVSDENRMRWNWIIWIRISFKLSGRKSFSTKFAHICERFLLLSPSTAKLCNTSLNWSVQYVATTARIHIRIHCYWGKMYHSGPIQAMAAIKSTGTVATNGKINSVGSKWKFSQRSLAMLFALKVSRELKQFDLKLDIHSLARKTPTNIPRHFAFRCLHSSFIEKKIVALENETNKLNACQCEWASFEKPNCQMLNDEMGSNERQKIIGFRFVMEGISAVMNNFSFYFFGFCFLGRRLEQERHWKWVITLCFDVDSSMDSIRIDLIWLGNLIETQLLVKFRCRAGQ